MSCNEIDMIKRQRATALKGNVTALFVLAIVAIFVSNITMIIYAIVLLNMSKTCSAYKTAGMCLLIASALGTISSWFFEEESVLLTLPAAVLSLISVYSEIQAHAEVLWGIDDDQSVKWENLWKYMIMSYGVLIGSIIVILILPGLGALIAVAAAVAMVVTSIMKIVYLYRMENVLKAIG